MLFDFTWVSGTHLLEEVVELLDGVERDVLDQFLSEQVHLARHAQDLFEDLGQLSVVSGQSGLLSEPQSYAVELRLQAGQHRDLSAREAEQLSEVAADLGGRLSVGKEVFAVDGGRTEVPEEGRLRVFDELLEVRLEEEPAFGDLDVGGADDVDAFLRGRERVCGSLVEVLEAVDDLHHVLGGAVDLRELDLVLDELQLHLQLADLRLHQLRVHLLPLARILRCQLVTLFAGRLTVCFRGPRRIRGLLRQDFSGLAGEAADLEQVLLVPPFPQLRLAVAVLRRVARVHRSSGPQIIQTAVP